MSYVLPEKTDREDVQTNNDQAKPVTTSRSVVLVSEQTVNKRSEVGEEEGFSSQSEPTMTISGGSSSDQTGQELTLLESKSDTTKDQRS